MDKTEKVTLHQRGYIDGRYAQGITVNILSYHEMQIKIIIRCYYQWAISTRMAKINNDNSKC